MRAVQTGWNVALALCKLCHSLVSPFCTALRSEAAQVELAAL